ncbi:MAG: hypothetical protein JOY90_12180 [Bradyrhizobium sp.]|nr:hypothetical protein [Bradyrhizobium sp.]
MRFALMLLLAAPAAAVAGEGFDLVIPGRPGVPIMMNGVDVSYAVIEGDFGLGKSVHNPPRVFGGHLVDPEPLVGHYYPSVGLKPGYGRAEIEAPADRKPKGAESFHQSWSAQSPSLPAPSARMDVPLDPPPVMMAPRGREGRIQREFSDRPQEPSEKLSR